MGFGVTLLCCDLLGGKLARDCGLLVLAYAIGVPRTNVTGSKMYV